MRNIQAVDECMRQLSKEIQEIVDVLEEYEENQLLQLEKLKAALSAEISTALKEAETTMHEDSPILTHPLAVIVREYKDDSKTLRIFSYLINTGAIISSIKSMCKVTRSNPNSTDHITAGIYENSLRVYDFVADSIKEMTLESKFTKGISTCVLPTGALLCIGGRPASTQTSIVDIKTGRIEEFQAMKRPRGFAGLVYIGACAYAFGSSTRDNTCEQFDMTQRSWKRLPNMRYERYSFTPSHLDGSIYLLTTKAPIEVYNIASGAFQELSVKWTGMEGGISSLFIDGELNIFTSWEIGKWKPGDNSIAISKSADDGAGFSQCQPARHNRNVFFIGWQTGMMKVLNLDTRSYTYK